MTIRNGKTCTPEQLLARLLAKVADYMSPAEMTKIREAFGVARMAHQGQKRLTGEEYIFHPLRAALILADRKLDTDTIVAAILHDALEDTETKPEVIAKKFGRDVLLIVEGVTRITGLRLRGRGEKEFVENLRKMILAMANDLRVVLVKLADRLDNMQTLWVLPKPKQLENARETLEIYAPLAERLGIGELKGELEDLAFSYVHPEEFAKVRELSRVYYLKSADDIAKMKSKLLRVLTKENIKAKINGRKKHLYSLWRKLQRKAINWDIEKVNDIIALRVIVDEVEDCYKVLGIIHALYKPVPRIGISDFIAQPKPNGYRSIHTKVFGPSRRIVEVQIRTDEMHEEAEYGIAAHWAYSEVKSKQQSEEELEKKGVGISAKKNWIGKLVEWQKEFADSEEYLRAVKFDALKHRNFIFSPEGDVYDLPSGATPVDFAYAVHTGLGSYIKQARVNGRVVPLNHQLKSGDIVEITKAKNPQKPGLKWLDFVATALARKEIKKANEIN